MAPVGPSIAKLSRPNRTDIPGDIDGNDWKGRTFPCIEFGRMKPSFEQVCQYDIQPIRVDLVQQFYRRRVKQIFRDEYSICKDKKTISRDAIEPIYKDEIEPIYRDEIKPICRNEIKQICRDDVRPFFSSEVRPFSKNEVQPFSKNEVQPTCSHGIKKIIRRKTLCARFDGISKQLTTDLEVETEKPYDWSTTITYFSKDFFQQLSEKTKLNPDATSFQPKGL